MGRLLLLPLVAVLLAPTALAQRSAKPVLEKQQAPGVQRGGSGDGCLGRASGDLDAGLVQARVFTNGNLFFQNDELGSDTPTYDVPKTGDVEAVYLSSLWIAGTVGGELRASAATYAQLGSTRELAPGPLDASGEPAGSCAAFDRVWNVARADVAAYEAESRVTRDLLEWPADLGAPVIDGDGDPDNYSLEGGDRPEILGDQTLFWVMNDVAAPHESTGSEPIGLEVRVAAFAKVGATPAERNATFYRVTLVYRGDEPFEDAYLGLFNDFDVGYLFDDYLGSDPDRGLAFAYNGDDFDDASGGGNYGDNPPAVGLDFLSTPGGAPFAAATYFTSGATDATSGPDSAEEYYDYLRGRWADGEPFVFGGTGRMGTLGATDDPYPFVYPDDPPSYWSEACIDGTEPGTTAGCSTATEPDDRRSVASAGPFTLQPGESTTFTLGMLWARGSSNLDSVDELKAASDLVQAAFDAGTLTDATDGDLPAPTLSAPADLVALPEAPTLRWGAVPGADVYTVHVDDDPGFPDPRRYFPTAPSAMSGAVTPGRAYFWRVRAEGPGAISGWSEVRQFRVGQGGSGAAAYLPFSRLPAFVEVAGPGGADPCGDDAVSTDGCVSTGGNHVYPSLNSTGEYAVFNADGVLGDPFEDSDPDGGGFVVTDPGGPEEFFAPFAPNDYEIRFTSEGGYAFEGLVVTRVPFEVWDVGPVGVGPLGENDPSDDVQLIPDLDSESTQECVFAYGDGELTVGLGKDFGTSDTQTYPATDVIANAFYVQDGETIESFETSADSLLAGDDCADGGILRRRFVGLGDAAQPSPIRNVVFLDTEPGGAEAPPEGVVVRFLSSKPTWKEAVFAVDMREVVRDGLVSEVFAETETGGALSAVPLEEPQDWPGVYSGRIIYRDGEAPPALTYRYGYFEDDLPVIEDVDRAVLLKGTLLDEDGNGIADAIRIPPYFDNDEPDDLGPFAFTRTGYAGSVVGQAFVLGAPAEEGDVVAAVDPNGVVAGAAPVFLDDGAPYVNVRVYGDDPLTAADEGLDPTEPFTLRLFDASTGETRELSEWLFGWRDTVGRPIPGFDDPERVFTFDAVVSGEPGPTDEPTAFRLHPAFPNPFAGSATVRFDLPERADVRLELVDLLGRPVLTLAEGPREAGTHRARVEAGGLASGVYLVVIEAGPRRAVERVTVIR